MSMFDIIMSGIDGALTLNGLGTGMEVGGNIVGGINRIRYGRDAQKAGDFQAQQLDRMANNALASGQRAAAEDDKAGQLAASRALAVAAASGGGASDPTVINMIANNAGEAAYRKAVSLYEGETRAQGLQAQASAKRYEGDLTRQNETQSGIVQMGMSVPSLLRGAARNASMLQRFGKNSKTPEGTQAEGSVRDWYVY